ncbi:MAG: hypothetical protein KBS95_02550 [Alistipes sp.]|nr:hypothetical protein [Candidatus Alistipes equi]
MSEARYEYITSDVTFKDAASNNVTFYGLVIFPDGFTKQATWKSEYTTWTQVNNAGLVCLADEADDSSSVRAAAYWTSTPDSAVDAYYVSLISNYANKVQISYYGRDCYYYVRIVTELN